MIKQAVKHKIWFLRLIYNSVFALMLFQCVKTESYPYKQILNLNKSWHIIYLFENCFIYPSTALCAIEMDKILRAELQRINITPKSIIFLGGKWEKQTNLEFGFIIEPVKVPELSNRFYYKTREIRKVLKVTNIGNNHLDKILINTFRWAYNNQLTIENGLDFHFIKKDYHHIYFPIIYP